MQDMGINQAGTLGTACSKSEAAMKTQCSTPVVQYPAPAST